MNKTLSANTVDCCQFTFISFRMTRTQIHILNAYAEKKGKLSVLNRRCHDENIVVHIKHIHIIF